MASTANDAAVRNVGDAGGETRVPTVSFVVLCYKLAHLLPECVNSILSQTYGDFEILIMDDRSPDNTEEVAKSFHDPRVRYVLNPQNLGFLRNENEGVRLSRGKYVWIISADDYLRKPYILQRYVELMEKKPNVGFTFCSGVSVLEGREMGVLDYSKYRERDGVIGGHALLIDLLRGNFVLAPSAMARRECYEKISLYPLELAWADLKIDMVWAADWYVWCLFALSYDVAYFAEPMVCYREHNLSISSNITQDNLKLCVLADIAVPWSIRQKAVERGLKKLAKDCLTAVAHEYSRHGESKRYRGALSTMSVAEFEESLRRGTPNESERDWIRARFYAAQGDRLFSEGDLSAARKSYLECLRRDPRLVKVYAKLLLLSLGKPGIYLRAILRSIRNTGN